MNHKTAVVKTQYTLFLKKIGEKFGGTENCVYFCNDFKCVL